MQAFGESVPVGVVRLVRHTQITLGLYLEKEGKDERDAPEDGSEDDEHELLAVHALAPERVREVSEEELADDGADVRAGFHEALDVGWDLAAAVETELEHCRDGLWKRRQGTDQR